MEAGAAGTARRMSARSSWRSILRTFASFSRNSFFVEYAGAYTARLLACHSPVLAVLLILWGLDILLGRSRFFRFIVGLIALFFFLAIMIYGLAKTASPLVKNMPPDVVNAAGNINAQNPLTQ